MSNAPDGSAAPDQRLHEVIAATWSPEGAA
jgi:hypothetical protein